MEATKYTPSIIANSQEILNIPLYQRLFEWERPQIEQLLSDLLEGFLQKPNEPYYIGMLTAHKNDLVDGQQRFTVLILMAIAFEDKRFLPFLRTSDDKVRLSFFAREKDKKYLSEKINHLDTPYKNVKMEKGIQYIQEFLKNNERKKKLEETGKTKDEFIDYIFNNLTFFISKLPDKYQSQDLNKYFEAMNAGGRGLENHEILKVDLLKKLTGDKELYTRIWNLVSDMDKPLIRPKYENKVREDDNKTNERQLSAIKEIDNTPNSFRYCNDSSKSNENSDEFLSIREIVAITDAPKPRIRSIGERSILSFSEFLLQVLWLQLGEEERKNAVNFFNIHKLQETFKANLHAEKIEFFFQNLLKYRILFDYFIIRISNKEDNTTTYTLAFKEEEENSDVWRKKLIQYQSMLYVSTSSNIWLTEILKEIAKHPIAVTFESMHMQLVRFDNARHKEFEKNSLSYGKIDRYWFWRLDYYLWERRYEFFKDEQLKVVEKYTFKQNRSIEHLHPQTSEENWNGSDLHGFGNLAMISPEFNSTQSNDDIKIKYARIETQIEGKYNLESIKMLIMYNDDKDKNWSQKLAKEHGEKMIEILRDSISNNVEAIIVD